MEDNPYYRIAKSIMEASGERDAALSEGKVLTVSPLTISGFGAVLDGAELRITESINRLIGAEERPLSAGDKVILWRESDQKIYIIDRVTAG